MPYAYINEIGFDVDTGIEIMTSQKKITITGRNLMRLFEHLAAYRVRFVQMDTGQDTEEDGLFVQAVLIESA